MPAPGIRTLQKEAMYPSGSSEGTSEDTAESLPSTSQSEVCAVQSEEGTEDDSESESDGETSDEEEEEEEDDVEDDGAIDVENGTEESSSDNASEEDDISDIQEFDGSEATTTEDDSNSGEDDQPVVKRKRRRPLPQELESSSGGSSDSDGQSDKCPICLSRFGVQDVGSPESCDHAFCLDCILEWSKTMNTCPVDRRVFSQVIVRNCLAGKVLRKVLVKGKATGTEEEVDNEEPTYCEVCGLSDREDRMLLCDGCDMGFHLECLDPPLHTVPVEEWFCTDCVAENGQNLAEATGIEDGEVLALLEDENVSMHNIGLRSRGGYRLLPRTRQSENVRRRVQLNRAVQRRTLAADRDTTEPAVSGVRRRRSTVKRRRKTKRRKKTAARKTPSSSKTSSADKTKKRKTRTRKTKGKKSSTRKRKTAPKRKGRRRRRRGVKRRTSSKKITPPATSTAKSRLANQLGIKMLPNRLLPVMNNSTSVKTDRDSCRPSGTRHSPLRIFGARNELYAFCDSYDDGDVAVARTVPAMCSRRRHAKALSSSAVLSHRPLGIGGAQCCITTSTPSRSSPSHTESFDLLSTIMENQTSLTVNSKYITIKRDGSLVPNVSKDAASDGAKKRPTDPVHSNHDNRGSRDCAKGSSHGVPSSGGHSSIGNDHWLCPSADAQSSSLYEYRRNVGDGSAGEGSSSVYTDYGNKRSHSSAHKKQEKKAEKEKKQVDDDDIDIYSDIDADFEKDAEDASMDRMSASENMDGGGGGTTVNFDQLVDRQHSVNDDEVMDRGGDDCSDDDDDDDDNDLVIDESVKHEEETPDMSASHQEQMENEGLRTDDDDDDDDDDDLVIDVGRSEQEGDANDADRKLRDEDNGNENEHPFVNASGHPGGQLNVEDVSSDDEDDDDKDEQALACHSYNTVGQEPTGKSYEPEDYDAPYDPEDPSSYDPEDPGSPYASKHSGSPCNEEELSSLYNPEQSGSPCSPEDPGSPYDPEQPSSPCNLEDPGSPYDPEQPGSPCNLEEPGSPCNLEEPGSPYEPEEPGSPYDPEQPGSPYDPEQPGSPYDPEQPGSQFDSEEPGSPYDPEQPGSPCSPEEPGSPYDPEQPGSPSEQEIQSEGEENSEVDVGDREDEVNDFEGEVSHTGAASDEEQEFVGQGEEGISESEAHEMDDPHGIDAIGGGETGTQVGELEHESSEAEIEGDEANSTLLDDGDQQGLNDSLPAEPDGGENEESVSPCEQEGYENALDGEEYVDNEGKLHAEEPDYRDHHHDHFAEEYVDSETGHVGEDVADRREVLSPEAQDEANDEAEIDVSKLSHRRRRKAIMHSKDMSQVTVHHGLHSRHKRKRGTKDYEEGEIVDESPRRKIKLSRKTRQSWTESTDEYDNMPRVNMSELPRIPKIKRDRFNKECTAANGQSDSGATAGTSGETGGSKRTGVMARLDKSVAAEISWKKLSHNSKTRNYRDGKPKSNQKHYRLKEIREAANVGNEDIDKRVVVVGNQGVQPGGEDGGKKRVSEAADRDKRKEKSRDSNYFEWVEKHAEPKDWQQHAKDKDSSRGGHEKRSSNRHEKEKHKEKHREKRGKGEKQHKEWKEKRKHRRGRSKEMSVEEAVPLLPEKSHEKFDKGAAVEKKMEKKEQKREKMRQVEKIHREEKYREHKKREKEKERAKAAHATVVADVASREASPIESKEVYASGDSIIVNVNFSRPTGKENVVKEVTGLDDKVQMEKDQLRKLDESHDTRKREQDLRERLGEKRRMSEEMMKESKYSKYEDSRVLSHRDELVSTPPVRWNPFGSDADEPSTPIEIDLDSDGSPARDGGIDNNADSDSDVVEILPPSSIASADPVESKSEEMQQSPDSHSEDLDNYDNSDSNMGEAVPHFPQSPAEDNSVYDPFEPTKSPSPSLSSSPDLASSLSGIKAENPEPPPLPELPPLPPEPEPDQPLPPHPCSPPALPPGSPKVSLGSLAASCSQTSPAALMLTSTVTTCSGVRPHPTVQVATGAASIMSTMVGTGPLPPQPQCSMPPPIPLPNIRVPPPNFIPRSIPPPPPNATTPVQMPPVRSMGWPNLLFPPSQQVLRPGGNFIAPPPMPSANQVTPTSQPMSLTQIGNLLHSQAAQLALLTGVRPGGPSMSMPPPMAITSLLRPPIPVAQQQQQHYLPVMSSQNGEARRPAPQDVNEVIDMDVDSPYSPGDALDSGDVPPKGVGGGMVGSGSANVAVTSAAGVNEASGRFKDRFDSLLGFVHSRKENVPAKQVDRVGHARGGRGHGASHPTRVTRDRVKDESRRRHEAQKKHIVRFEIPDRQQRGARGVANKKSDDGKKEVTVKMDETQLKILDELPSSAVEMQVKEKFLKKLNRQERVIEEVKLAIKPYYNRREISKEDYKEILRKSVPKICHNKSGEINPVKIKALVEGYVKKFKYHRKSEPHKSGSSKKS